MNTILTEKLSYVSGYRENRQALANFILTHEAYFPELLEHCFSNEENYSHKACWVTELVCKGKLTWLFPHLDFFLIKLPSLKNDSSIRPLAKVCELLCESYFIKKDPKTLSQLNDAHLEKLAEINFDWLISNVKVATKAYAMHCLFLLGKKYHWIYPELKHTLEQGFAHHSAAYKARARHILKKI
ncbi:hypothetical protein [Galbibacter pacificus]|uniref:Adenylosuccinate lyase n=1 Tax=Galbibacter pacificus TaxID=2996052 RepID=A0ABT6FP29_9FLAO|nr:hypothetical protein [Galbibacter pacificus]MDG3581540.1 hypothetical protein [Galbibacter pacificus]MDG3585018.1 hypothetical protein [Galbibacter pacificus]